MRGMSREENKAVREGILNLSKQILDEHIDNQVTLQLLVEKGIITAEEVAAKRQFIKTRPIYKAMYQHIEEHEQTLKEEDLFFDNFKKILNGEDVDEKNRDMMADFLFNATKGMENKEE